mmetsp:Transcript_15357/g.48964  ORF Transcript_15357/g.48964 Transcript_15357/m.48964 type:complete len:255 (-) Transcript_15357:822-1586(-)
MTSGNGPRPPSLSSWPTPCPRSRAMFQSNVLPVPPDAPPFTDVSSSSAHAGPSTRRPALTGSLLPPAVASASTCTTRTVGRQHWASKAGVSPPCSWMRSIPVSSAIRFTSFTDWSMNTPTTSGRPCPPHAAPRVSAQARNQRGASPCAGKPSSMRQSSSRNSRTACTMALAWSTETHRADLDTKMSPMKSAPAAAATVAASASVMPHTLTRVRRFASAPLSPESRTRSAIVAPGSPARMSVSPTSRPDTPPCAS